MKYTPSDFFVGLVDFFSVLLPGALLSFLLLGWADSYMFGPVLPEIQNGPQAWVAFIFASYLLGHFIFLVAAYLDDVFYSPIYVPLRRIGGRLKYAVRKRIIEDLNVRHLAYEHEGEQQKEGEQQNFVDRDWALRAYAEKLKDHHLGEDHRRMVNAFQWAKANVLLRSPDAAAQIHRYEADSKFFRSLVIVLMLTWFLYPYLDDSAAPQLTVVRVVLIVLIVVALLRYGEQRRKSVNAAYAFLAASELASQSNSTAAADEKPLSSAPSAATVISETEQPSEVPDNLSRN
jgi:ABC-type multidrug transport system fused ATPase/permease subunit